MVHEGVHRSFPRAAQYTRARAGSERSAWRKCRQQFPHSLADVGILFPRLAATPSPDCSEAHARTKKRRSVSARRNGTRGAMRAQVEAIHRIARAFLSFSWTIKVNRPYLIYGLVITVLCVTSCATISRHEFSEQTAGWQTKSGQLMYRSAKTTLIGDALVRFSKTGDFELTVSKGPGVTLLSIRHDAAFAEVKGGLARQGWFGPVEQSSQQ